MAQEVLSSLLVSLVHPVTDLVPGTRQALAAFFQVWRCGRGDYRTIADCGDLNLISALSLTHKAPSCYVAVVDE